MDPFYRAFEDKYRNTRVVKSLLAFYSTFTQPLKKAFGCPKVLDLGCGRGEWLQLLREEGLQAKGVDADEGMLRACRESGLEVEQFDIAHYLSTQADESLEMVTSFHVAEQTRPPQHQGRRYCREPFRRLNATVLEQAHHVQQ